MIVIEDVPVQVRCQICGTTSKVRPNRLLCASCGTWRVTLISGDEMVLARVELADAPATHETEKERADV